MPVPQEERASLAKHVEWESSGSDQEREHSPRWSVEAYGWQGQQPRLLQGGRCVGSSIAAALKARLGWPHEQHEGGASAEQLCLWQRCRSSSSSWGRPHAWAALLSACLLATVLCWGCVRLSSGGAGGSTRLLGRQQECHLDLDGSPWEQHCQRLQNLCVDQGSIVLYDDVFQQHGAERAGDLPKLEVDTSRLFEYPWRNQGSSGTADDNTDDGSDDQASAESGAGGSNAKGQRKLSYVVQNPTKTRHIDALPLRPATSEEPTPYLQDPEFSSCTVPIMFAASWRQNFFHIFRDMGSVLLALLRRTPWRAHAKVVVVTPDGLRLTGPEAQLLPALSNLSVQSFADFSNRLPPGARIGDTLDPRQPPASFEGGERRCFRNAFFCAHKIPLGRGPTPEEEAHMSGAELAAALAKEVPFEPYTFGQQVASYVQQQQLQQQGKQQGLFGSRRSGGGASSSSGGGSERAKSRGTLNVVIMKRSKDGERQLLNSAELLQRCNAWSFHLPGSSEVVTANCQEVMFPDLASGVRAARDADVFIGMHGANLANGWMMRPGAAVLEIIPYQFEYGRGTFAFSVGNALDATSQVLWWVGVVCDPAISTPGPNELAGLPLEEWWPRDRNARVPWAVVQEALQRVARLGGDRQRYMDEYWGKGMHRINFNASGVMGHEAPCPGVPRPEKAYTP